MLYETAARAAEILALNVEDLDLEHRRAPVRSKGGAAEWVYWDSGTAHLPPRLLRFPDGNTRTHGPLFLSERRPVPARRSADADICPHTGRARLGYDRARVLLDTYAGLDLHQLRHSAATHLGDAEVGVRGTSEPDRASARCVTNGPRSWGSTADNPSESVTPEVGVPLRNVSPAADEGDGPGQRLAPRDCNGFGGSMSLRRHTFLTCRDIVVGGRWHVS
jgi:hypothetical protein